MSRIKNKEPKNKADKDTLPPSELADMIKQVRKSKGDETVSRADKIPSPSVIHSGSFPLDFALLGGYPVGQSSTLFGMESSGKSMMAHFKVANFQRKYPDKVAVWVDQEQMFDPTWAETLGIDLSRLYVCSFATGEEAVDSIIAFMYVEEIGHIVIDSIPTLVPFANIDKSAEDATMAELARLVGRFCSKANSAWIAERKRDHRVTITMINQMRTNVGQMFGNPESTAGGKQQLHFNSTRVRLSVKEIAGKDSNDIEGIVANLHGFIISKSKNGRSIRKGEFTLVLDEDNALGLPFASIDHYNFIYNYGKKFGFIKGGGSSWRLSYDSEKKFSKKEEIISWLINNPEEENKLKAHIICKQRVAKKKSILPPDGYLYGHRTEDEINLNTED